MKKDEERSLDKDLLNVSRQICISKCVHMSEERSLCRYVNTLEKIFLQICEHIY